MNSPLKPVLLALVIANLPACKPDGDDQGPNAPENEEEVITTVRLTFVDTVGPDDDTVRFEFQDLDGDGGNAPVLTTAPLAVGHQYLGILALSNGSVTPPDDITAEVEEEGTMHQFFFAIDGANIAWVYADADGNGDPIGLRTDWTSPPGSGSSGTLKLTLRHQPDKGAPGVSTGDITHAGGETDVEVIFPLVIE